MTVADAVAKAVAGVAGDGAGESAASQEEGQGADRWRVRQETRQQFKATVTERAAQVEEMDAALRAAEEELRGARRERVILTLVRCYAGVRSMGRRQSSASLCRRFAPSNGRCVPPTPRAPPPPVLAAAAARRLVRPS